MKTGQGPFTTAVPLGEPYAWDAPTQEQSTHLAQQYYTPEALKKGGQMKITVPGKSGALSSNDEGIEGLEALWQVPLSDILSLARRLAKGNSKYEIHNWRKGLGQATLTTTADSSGDASFVRDRAGHAVVHLFRLLNGDESVDSARGNVDALRWFCMFMSELLVKNPALVREAFYAEPRGEKI